MTFRLASYNVENLFSRAIALDTSTWESGRPALAAFDRFNAVAGNPTYSDDDKKEMLGALELLGVLRRDDNGSRVVAKGFGSLGVLRENRGKLLKQPRNGSVEITAQGRDDWIGWVELRTEPVDETATRMTARVVDDVAADVLCVVEAESRPALVRFNDDLLHHRYPHTMLIDGNDPRGIDIGLFCGDAFEISSMRSHVDTPDPVSHSKSRLFSRDCPVYQLRSRSGQDLFVLPNHLKSQSFTGGNPDALRSRQSAEVRNIYDGLRAEGAEFIAVLGDLNKGPTQDSPPQHPTLEPLLGPGSPLVDTASLPVVDPGARPGTFQTCSARNRIDYILVSPELARKVTRGGIFREGLWGSPTTEHPPTAWTIYPEITKSVHAASDHAAVWIDIDL